MAPSIAAHLYRLLSFSDGSKSPSGIRATENSMRMLVIESLMISIARTRLFWVMVLLRSSDCVLIRILLRALWNGSGSASIQKSPGKSHAHQSSPSFTSDVNRRSSKIASLAVSKDRSPGESSQSFSTKQVWIALTTASNRVVGSTRRQGRESKNSSRWELARTFVTAKSPFLELSVISDHLSRAAFPAVCLSLLVQIRNGHNIHFRRPAIRAMVARIACFRTDSLRLM
jgi:hypothetical protein